MPKIRRYWRDKLGAPFETLLRTVDLYCHPEAGDYAYEDLKRRAQSAAADDVEMRQFRSELSRLLQGDREGLKPFALATAAEYDDGTDDAFLRRLWTDLYPDEPVPSVHETDPRAT